VRQDWQLVAQVRADDEQAIEFIDGRDRQSQRRHGRIGGLMPKIPLTQTMIDVRAAEPIGQARQQIEFLERARGMRQQAESLGAACRNFQQAGRLLERLVPGRLAPAAIGRAHLGCSSRSSL